MPSFNHTRADGLYDPCPECAAQMSKEDLLKVVADMQACRDHYPNLADDYDLASELIKRLNALVEHSEGVCADIERLVETRVTCSEEALTHPTLQVTPSPAGPTLGFLGLLNGIVGVRPNGSGHIAAVFDDQMKLESFVLNKG